MKKFLSRVGCAVGALALLLIIAIALPVSAQQPSSVNPTASSVKEQQLLEQLGKIQGRGSIPNVTSYTIEQPAGREWRFFHEVILRWIGAIVLIGMLALLAIFYLIRGTVKIAAGRSGRTILRFDILERTVHWMTAISFVVLAISGLNISFGKSLILPLIGPETFTDLSIAFKYAHNFLSFPFTIGVVCMFFLWVKDNIPDRADIDWLKAGGGIIGENRPPAGHFNAGQKGIFWIVVLGGATMAISGYMLIFPFYVTNITGMQWAQIFHGVVSVLFIAAIFSHIYIGTLGMEGAFEAMGSGEVDLNWAKEHHRLWVEQEMGGKTTASGAKPRMTPAE